MLPSQEAQLKGKKAHQVDVNSVKLKQNTAILELLIQNSEVMGFLSEEIEEQYKTCLSMPSYQSQSEGELLDEETSCGAAKRKVTKKKHIRRRSGSLSRVLSVMGKAMGLGRTPGTSKGENQIIIYKWNSPVAAQSFLPRSRVILSPLDPLASLWRYSRISFAKRPRYHFQTQQ